MHLSNLMLKVHHALNYPVLQMYPLLMDKLSCCLAILVFKHLKSVTSLLSCITCLLINITGLKYAEKPPFSMLNSTVFSFILIIFSCLLIWYGLMKNGVLSMTSMSIFIFGQVSISSLRPNTSLYL